MRAGHDAGLRRASRGQPELIPLLDAHPDRLTGDTRLLCDKAYSHNSTRADLRKRRIKHTIPERSNQISYRKNKGAAGGRPPAFDPKVYCHRNTVERGFNRLKQWRGIATRYDCEDEGVPPRIVVS